MEGPFPQIHGPNFCEEKKIELLKNNSTRFYFIILLHNATMQCKYTYMLLEKILLQQSR